MKTRNQFNPKFWRSRLFTFYKHATVFTAVAGYAGVHGHEGFESIALCLMGLKTFWTIARGQVSGVDGQMAIATPHPGFLGRQEDKLTMRAGEHRAFPSWEMYARCLSVSLSKNILSRGDADK
jgi:hypothetical protein